ncbi:glycosyltransferase family 2 protein [Streptomyces sp. NPDC003247]|uniref:glycosyltransferase family 2 protein n=1 Tax=Streptomyces sp. NPDC003247 TaxID=3364677 RepID=UPI0036BA74D7
MPVQAVSDRVRPGITVVVPVKGRVELTRRLLESLEKSAARCPEPAEVVVVDDSDSPEAAEHQESCRRHGARYVGGPAHVGAKRNLGARLARHDLLCFVDSDCRAAPELLSRHVQALRGAPSEVAAVAGPALLAQEGQTAISRIMNRSWLLNGHHEDPLHHERMTCAGTSNLAVRRNAFEAVGGFPEDSPHPLGGEDIDFGLRLTGRGHITACDPEAVVTHDATSTDSVRAVCRRLMNYGRSEQWLCLVHRQRRRFRLNPVSVLALTGLASLGGPRGTRGRRALAVPAVAGVLLGARTIPLLHGERSAGALADSVACALLECFFDLGAVVGAVEHRRPDLLFAGFEMPDDSAYRRTDDRS